MYRSVFAIREGCKLPVERIGLRQSVRGDVQLCEADQGAFVVPIQLQRTVKLLLSRVRFAGQFVELAQDDHGIGGGRVRRYRLLNDVLCPSHILLTKFDDGKVQRCLESLWSPDQSTHEVTFRVSP